MIPFEVSPGNTLFLEDVGISSKTDICCSEGINSDLSEVLGGVINTMASYLFLTFYLELCLWNIPMKLFNCIIQLASVYAKLFLLISEFIAPKWMKLVISFCWVAIWRGYFWNSVKVEFQRSSFGFFSWYIVIRREKHGWYHHPFVRWILKHPNSTLIFLKVCLQQP